MENTSNELVKLFRERLKYPIITIYSIILLIYNWDILLYLFLSSKNIEKRIYEINTVYSDPTFSRLWIPYIKALIFSILAPLTMLGLDYILLKINMRRMAIKSKRTFKDLDVKLNHATLEFKIEEAKSGKKSIEQLQERLTQIENSHSAEVNSLNDSITALENQVQTKNLIIEELQTSEKLLVNKITEIVPIDNNAIIVDKAHDIIDIIIENLTGYLQPATLKTYQIYIRNILSQILFNDYESYNALKFSKSEDDAFEVFIDLAKEHNLIVQNKESKNISLSALGLMCFQILAKEISKRD